MGPIYVMLLNIANNRTGFTLTNIGLCLLLTILILYIIKIFSAIIEYALVKVFTNIKMKYNILYPFTIDERINFKPIVLLMNPETVRDIMPLNLIFCNQNEVMDDAKLKTSFKKILLINSISDVTSYILVFILIDMFFMYDLSLAFSISCIALEIQKFLSDGVTWKGMKYIYKENSFVKYLYSFPNIEELDAKDYANYLALYQGELDLDTLNIIENYLLQSIHERSCWLSSDKLDELLMKGYENNEFVMLKTVTIVNVIKLIGLLSLKCENSYYLEIFNKHITKIIEDHSRAGENYDFLYPYINYINCKINNISLYHYFDSNRKTIFSYRTKLEKSIFVKG